MVLRFILMRNKRCTILFSELWNVPVDWQQASKPLIRRMHVHVSFKLILNKLNYIKKLCAFVYVTDFMAWWGCGW